MSGRTLSDGQNKKSDGDAAGLTRDEAACRIQKAWRRHIDIQVYHYYRDLISFYSRGDPKQMLKCVNPKEAELLDFASGISLRFRLAGEKFPPNIYYKIFTFRTVADINSFAPRDYTTTTRGPVAASFQNSHVVIAGQEEDLTRWYQRRENNDWRLVSDRLMPALNGNIKLDQSTHTDVRFFHYSKQKRKKDVDRKRKLMKRKWMARMYAQGKKEEEEEAAVVDVCGGEVSKEDGKGVKEEEQEEEEDDLKDLLIWSHDLDYELYVNSWLELATASSLPDALLLRTEFERKIAGDVTVS